MDNCFEAQVLAYIDRKKLIAPGSHVIAAVSGGPDSMALLQFLLRHKTKLCITLEAAHVDHRLRHNSAEAAEYVQGFCEKQGIPFRCFTADAPIAHRSEEWSRQLRYGFFDTLARENVCIATAHTLCDQAETLLFRLARGTGEKGAAGIPPKRGVYIRPMLSVTKQQALEYCESQGLAYITDPDNLTDDYARNRIRHHVVPALENAVPGAAQQLGRFCERISETQQYLQMQGEQLLTAAQTQQGYLLQVLAEAHPVELQQALRCLVQKFRPLRERDMPPLLALVAQGSGSVQLGVDVFLHAGGGLLWCETQSAVQQPAPPTPANPGNYSLPGEFRLEIKLLQGKECEENIKFALENKKLLNNCADYDKINGSLCLRTRAAGDFFRPMGRGVGKTLKKFYNELGIPPAQRPLLPLAAVGSRVVWLWGQGFENGLAPTAQTTRLLMICPKENKIMEDSQ